MDIALQVMINPPTHDLSADPAKEARRLKRGDVIGVFLASDLATIDSEGDYIPDQPGGSARLGFVYVKNVPEVGIEKVKSVLMGDHWVDEPGTLTIHDWAWQQMQTENDYSPFVATPVLQSTSTTFLMIRVENNDLVAARTSFFSGLSEVDQGDGTAVLSGNIYTRTLAGNLPVMKLRKKYGIDVPSIPANIQNKINADRHITFLWSQVKSYFKQKAESRLVTDADLA